MNLSSLKKSLLGKLFSLRDSIMRNRIVSIKVGKFDILANHGHALPRYLKNRPSYASNLTRLAEMVHKKYPNLTFIDIGANIGDTVAFLETRFSCPIVCIEGDDFYFNLLRKNIAQFKDVHIFKTFLSDVSETASLQTEKSNGTLSIVSKQGSSNVPTITLDSFFDKHKEFLQNAKMIKIDTDGYDLKIIRGGMKSIKKVLPVLFFEYDRFFLSRAGEDGLSIFSELKDAGYRRILFFDNIGRFLVSTETDNIEMISQLYNYTYRKNGAFPFYDVCVFPMADDDIANSFISEEEKRYNEDII